MIKLLNIFIDSIYKAPNRILFINDILFIFTFVFLITINNNAKNLNNNPINIPYSNPSIPIIIINIVDNIIVNISDNI